MPEQICRLSENQSDARDGEPEEGRQELSQGRQLLSIKTSFYTKYSRSVLQFVTVESTVL